MIGLVLAAAVASSPCLKLIRLEGDGAAIARIREYLQAPVTESAAGDCGVLVASVSKVGGALVIDADGKTLEVHRPQAAAAWLESRIRPDLAAPLLELGEGAPAIPAIAEEAPAIPASAEEAPASPTIAEAAPAIPTVAATDGLEVAGRAEIGRSRLGSELGAAGVASVPIGAFDALLIVRGAAAERFQPAGLSAASAWNAEAIAGLRLPWRLAGIVVAPGLGAGVGVDGVSRDRCPGCLPVVEDDASTTRAALRTEAFLDASVPIAGGIRLALSASASASPFASGDPTLPAWIPPGTLGAEHLSLPAAPGARIRLGAGLSWRGR